jgi:RNA polymerase sigma-70 factor (ECF subfamily)
MRRPPDLSDDHTRLLLRAQRGDADAFAALYAALGPVVRDFAASVNGWLTVHDREDVVQEVFSRTWEDLSAYRGQASAKTYLLAVAHNVILEHLRRNRKESAVPTYIPSQPAHDITGQDELPPASRDQVDAINRLRDHLPGPQRRAIELVVVQGISVAEAAARMGCTIGAVYKQLSRAKEFILGALNKNG